MTPDFVIWLFDAQFPHACSLDELEQFDEIFRIWKGEKLGKAFPSSARYSMRADRPTATVLTDSLHNTDRLLVVSDRLKDFLEKNNTQEIEYLKVAVRDHKKKTAPGGYSILNLLNPVDCLDRTASKAKVSRVNKDRVEEIKKLVIKPETIPANRALFRIVGFPPAQLVRRDLAEAITKEGFTGMRWVELSKYPEK